jgi:sugar phosphate isomerase/epimerase
VTQTDLIARLLDRYSNVKVCLDTARLYLQDRLDPHFDAKKVIATYAKYAELIHLSNMQIDGSNRVVQKRQPVRPSLKPEDGWAPIADYIGIISRQNDKVKIMFEHRSDRVTDEELAECYDWVDVLLQTQTE